MSRRRPATAPTCTGPRRRTASGDTRTAAARRRHCRPTAERPGAGTGRPSAGPRRRRRATPPNPLRGGVSAPVGHPLGLRHPAGTSDPAVRDGGRPWAALEPEARSAAVAPRFGRRRPSIGRCGAGRDRPAPRPQLERHEVLAKSLRAVPTPCRATVFAPIAGLGGLRQHSAFAQVQSPVRCATRGITSLASRSIERRHASGASE